jgi:S-adenosylmethionine-diacylglycerol 3-amino-3-carboxypropyl transferase
MTAALAREPASQSDLLGSAVHRSDILSVDGALERAFTMAFRDLVYAQIWEDPVIDMEALDIRSSSEIVAIASGGCNLLSYLTADPARVHGVDLNAAHVALCRLKLAALSELPDYDAFYKFIGVANDPANVEAFDRHLAPRLDAASRQHWDGRDRLGRRRITAFSRNVYRHGLLGRFIGMAHLLARRYGVDPRTLTSAGSKVEMQWRFDRDIAPLFEKRMIRTMLNNPLSLYGLGIPPAQYTELAGEGPRMADVVRERLRKLLCDFDLRDNYFAWQALTRGYAPGRDASLPPYLQREQFEVISQRTARVAVRQVSMTAFLAERPSASLDRYVLLDAQDWMTPAMLTHLWREITRTARPGSRVIFRTAGAPSVLPAKLDPSVLRMWDYQEQQSLALFKRDRSAIYGGFHIYAKAT